MDQLPLLPRDCGRANVNAEGTEALAGPPQRAQAAPDVVLVAEPREAVVGR